MFGDDMGNISNVIHYDTQEINELCIDDEYTYAPEKIKLILKEKEYPWYFNKSIINADNNQYKITGFITDDIENKQDDECNEIVIIEKKNKNYIFYIFCVIIIILLILLKIKKLSN